jgi:DNA-directed RNA polymerase subunit RPC12/RpoP
MVSLVCDKCNKHYKLEPEENPEDFDLRCNCGGILHTEIIENKNNRISQSTLAKNEQLINANSMEYKLKPVFTIIKYIFIILLFIGSIFWLFLFFPFGIIGFALIIYILFVDKKIKLVPCPRCGYKISPKAIICPRCGLEFKN